MRALEISKGNISIDFNEQWIRNYGPNSAFRYAELITKVSKRGGRERKGGGTGNVTVHAVFLQKGLSLFWHNGTCF